MGLFILLFFIFTFGGIAFYNYMLNTSKGLIVMGMFQGALAFSAIIAGMEKEIIKKARVLFGLISNAVFLYMVLMFESFRKYLTLQNQIKF